MKRNAFYTGAFIASAFVIIVGVVLAIAFLLLVSKLWNNPC